MDKNINIDINPDQEDFNLIFQNTKVSLENVFDT